LTAGLRKDAQSFAKSASVSNYIFVSAYALAFVNGFVQQVVSRASDEGISSLILDSAGISAVELFALASLIAIQREAAPRPLRRLDGLFFLIIVILILAPVSRLSALAMSAIGVYVLLDRWAEPNSRAAALIATSLSVTMLWAPLFLYLGSHELLSLDAHLVAVMLGTTADGNLVHTHGGYDLAVLKGCSSFQGFPLATLLWLSLTRLFNPSMCQYLVIPLVLLPLVIACNVTRMTMMAWGPDWLELMHGPFGAELTSTAILLLTACSAWATLRYVRP
jgi:exosortase/archaeosortase family protein